MCRSCCFRSRGTTEMCVGLKDTFDLRGRYSPSLKSNTTVTFAIFCQLCLALILFLPTKDYRSTSSSADARSRLRVRADCARGESRCRSSRRDRRGCQARRCGLVRGRRFGRRHEVLNRCAMTTTVRPRANSRKPLRTAFRSARRASWSLRPEKGNRVYDRRRGPGGCAAVVDR